MFAYRDIIQLYFFLEREVEEPVLSSSAKIWNAGFAICTMPIDVIYIAPTTSDTEDVHMATVIGIAKDGTIYEADVEIDAYADYFNRYGTSVFFA